MLSTITKSIRLSREESNEIASLSSKYAISEAALMKKWVLDGVRAQKLELAIQAYTQRKTDLRGGAAIADIPYQEFLHEIQTRHVIVLENDQFLDELQFLANAFNNEDLREAIQQVRAEAREFENWGR
jgi:hypothetical protein